MKTTHGDKMYILIYYSTVTYIYVWMYVCMYVVIETTQW